MDVELRELSFSYGPSSAGRIAGAAEPRENGDARQRPAVVSIAEQLSLSFAAGSITALLGPSGCGKTTLLSLLAGIVEPDSGRVAAPEGSRASMMFQEARLVPWLSVRENLELVLESTEGDPASRARLIEESLAAVGLADHAAAYPDQLSGGQRQRASMARAFAYPAELLLMDEPFQSLDVVLRIELINVFLRLWHRRGPIVVAVTHDPWEAARLADRCIVLAGPPISVAADLSIEKPRSSEQRQIGQIESKIFSALDRGSGNA